MDWTRLIAEPQYAAAAAGVVALLLALWLLRRRRRSAAAGAKRSEGLWQIIAAYRETHPSFYFILQAFQANHAVDQLCHDRDVMEAFQRLDRLRSASKPSPDARNSTLRLLKPEQDEAVRAPQAAMTTILLSVFRDPQYAADLPPQAAEELDRFLDSLTR